MRKWVLPDLANPLLIVRDPLVILIYGLALMRGVFPWRPAVLAIFGLGMMSLVFGMVSDVPLEVVLYGLRINYLHVPLVFLMPLVLDRGDVYRFGKVMLWLSPAVAWIMMQQYFSSRYAFWNVGVGGEAGTQLDGAMGKVRPSGPFSFMTGPVAWFTLVTAFIFYGWTHAGRLGRVALWAAATATVVAVAVSISRGLLMAVGVVLLFGLATLARDVGKAWRLVLPLLVMVALVNVLADEGLTAAFASRWENSTVRHGGLMVSIVSRFLGDFQAAWDAVAHAPLLGEGIGLGSNVGARFASGQAVFLLAEAEWPKIVLELGPVLGGAFILFRCWLAAHVMMVGLGVMMRTGDALGWLLGGASFLAVLSGQWGPPTILGYAVFGAGMALAAANPAPEEREEIEEEESGEATGGGADDAAAGDGEGPA